MVRKSDSFDVVYDDFSQGHFVGRVNTKQVRSTFTGPNVGVCQTDGTLLPLKAFWDATGVIGGNTAANSSRMILDPASDRIVWAGNTQASAITNVGSSPPLTISTVAIGAAVRVNSLPCAFNARVLWPTAGATIISLNANTMAAASITPGFTPINILCAYGNFVMACTTTNRVYFSNPGDETVWTVATDWFDVGDPGVVIAGMCVHQGALYIATSVGMWTVTGVPGQTNVLRQLTTVPHTEPWSIDTSIVRTYGVQGTTVSELAGTNQRGLNYGLCPDGRPALLEGAGGARVNTSIAFAYSDIGSVTDEGGTVTDLGATIWVLDFYNGQWTRREVTTAPVRMGSMQSSYGHLVYRAGAPDIEAIWMAPASAEELVCNSDGTAAVGTAELAEYFHPTPFVVKEVFAEVDYGSIQTVFDTAAAALVYPYIDRKIAVSVQTPGVPIERSETLDYSRASSSTMIHILPAQAQTGANYTRRRSFVRLRPTDHPQTYTVTPTVTLTGVKLRRLILRCEEQN